jgi:DNA-directed RNA polymerase subunit RPC12/RpoP
MDHAFCPGSRLLRQPAPELYPCPNCGAEVEIWSDELKRACPKCRKMVLRPGGMSCLEWCKQAKECVGEATYESWAANRCLGLKGRLLQALEEHFGSGSRHIAHAQAVLAEAESLARSEAADWHIVVPAALLHDVGVKPAEEKYGSDEPRYQEQEGPAVARAILLKLGLQLRDIDEVCDIVGHHHSPRAKETANFSVVYDADCLVNLGKSAAGLPRHERERLAREVFLTASGRKRAGELLLSA